MSVADQFKNIEVECDIFERPYQVLVYGGSWSGKTHTTVNLVKRHHMKFKKIIICGAKNELATDETTKHKTIFYDNEELPIYDPFQGDEARDNDPRQILLILDDLMSEVYSSQLVAKIFAKGRHINLSTIVILQSYVPQGTSKSLVPMLKNNASLQLFFNLRNRSEMNLAARRLEHSKKGQDFFNALVEREIYQKRFGYIAIFMDDSVGRYRNNLAFEDSLPFETVFLK